MWGRGGEAPPCGAQQGFHQLSSSPLTSQPVLNEGLALAGRASASGTHTVTIWTQSAVDPSMHLEYFQELPMSKLYLMESMHSK